MAAIYVNYGVMACCGQILLCIGELFTLSVLVSNIHVRNLENSGRIVNDILQLYTTEIIVHYSVIICLQD